MPKTGKRKKSEAASVDEFTPAELAVIKRYNEYLDRDVRVRYFKRM